MALRSWNLIVISQYAHCEYTLCIVRPMATNEVVLALLRNGPAHGYDLKRDHDAWFPDARPLAFGQVYATLGRLERSGHVEVRRDAQRGRARADGLRAHRAR